MILATRARMTSGTSKGLVIKSDAPICSARSSAFFSAVSTITGMCDSCSSEVTRESTSKPSITGIIRSSSTMDSLSTFFSISSSAWAPFSA